MLWLNNPYHMVLPKAVVEVEQLSAGGRLGGDKLRMSLRQQILPLVPRQMAGLITIMLQEEGLGENKRG
eukprot:SAG31_NODE_1105_length_9882_cov_5.270571_8_plen_69_part_00